MGRYDVFSNKKAGSDPVLSEKTIVSRSVVSVAVALLQVMHREMPKTMQNGDVAFILLVQCANSEKWEVTVLNSKYKYLTKVTINVCLPSPYNADSYYIRLI